MDPLEDFVFIYSEDIIMNIEDFKEQADHLIAGFSVFAIAMLALTSILVYFFVFKKKDESSIEKIAEEVEESLEDIGEQAQDASSAVIEEAEKIADDARQSLTESSALLKFSP